MTTDERQRILIVDDERVNRTILTELLKNEEYQVLLAKNGSQALERLSQDAEVDLILLDVLMPDLDGYEVLRQIKQNENNKDIPVIFITALNSVGDEERGLSLGAVDYIGKPFSPAIVKARVENQLKFVRQRKLLETLAGRDGLTEIANRRMFDEILDREWQRSQRSAPPLSLIMLDIDHFKQFNDRYGHARGDQILKSVARALTWSLRRPADFLARYGGEEFVIILPDTDAVGGKEVAERMRSAVEALAIEHAGAAEIPYVTVSIGGITSFAKADSPYALVDAADKMLYAAKKQGRNRALWNLIT